ncbi:hypothetical protein N431DRAFT_563618 [Stipitochalara longipes BDJ]|nr:hypothetical protein N431DRAFT_563618 [Stipitochalara longipes BDJ]
MTRQNKCDVCRKAKIKCDEDLPSCSGCVRRGKKCTRTHDHGKKDVRFVQVKGHVVDGAAGIFAAQSKEKIFPSNILGSSSMTSRRVGDASRVVVTLKTAPPQLNLLLPTSENSSLLPRWISMMNRDFRETAFFDTDTSWCFKNWTISIPQYIGTSLALDDAANCYLDCTLAFANPTATNLLSVQASKFKAVQSVRLALEAKGSQPVQSNILLAVQLLYMVEALMLESHSTMVTHVKGLSSLLNEYKKNSKALDADGNLIRSAMFMSAFSGGLVPALLKGENHDLDSANWFDNQDPPSNLPAGQQATQQAWQTMAQSYVAIPRLARLIREFQALPENMEREQEVIDLARRLYDTAIDPNFFSEATSLGQLWMEPTTFGDIADIIPTSYGFKSRKLVALLVMYWMSRLLICGLVDRLISTVPFTSRFFDTNAVEAEDVHIAAEVFKMVQYGLTPSLDMGSDTVRIQRLQVLSLLQMAFGAWYRIENRATTAKDEGRKEKERKIRRASTMKQLCLDLGNQIMNCMQLPLMTMISLQTISEMFAGGPLVPCDLPET